MTYPASHYHANNTDTLDAIVSAIAPWTATGSVTGDNSTEANRYDFVGLADDTEYTVRVRAGVNPAASDIVVATIEPDVATAAAVAALPQYGDTTNRNKVTADADDLVETITKVV